MLLYKYDRLINFSETSMQEALNKDIKYKEFYSNIKVALRTHPLKNSQKLNKVDKVNSLLLYR